MLFFYSVLWGSFLQVNGKHPYILIFWKKFSTKFIRVIKKSIAEFNYLCIAMVFKEKIILLQSLSIWCISTHKEHCSWSIKMFINSNAALQFHQVIEDCKLTIRTNGQTEQKRTHQFSLSWPVVQIRQVWLQRERGTVQSTIVLQTNLLKHQHGELHQMWFQKAHHLQWIRISLIEIQNSSNRRNDSYST